MAPEEEPQVERAASPKAQWRVKAFQYKGSGGAFQPEKMALDIQVWLNSEVPTSESISITFAQGLYGSDFVLVAARDVL